MKKRFIISLLLVFGWIFFVNAAWAIDVGWMQKGVRVWYFGAVGSGSSSNAEEAYLFSDINGNNAQVTHHSGLTFWTSQNQADTNAYSIIDQGPFWIHPTVLQNIKVGDFWMGIEIESMYRVTYNSYDNFKNNNDEFDSLPYLLLPIKTLFDLQPQREVVKLVYGIPYYNDVWGTAFFDSETGLCLFNLKFGLLSSTTFFILSEINYDFAIHTAYAEDNGPHTGFKSRIIKATVTPINLVDIESSVETRFGGPIQTFTSTSAAAITNFLPIYENYCFFESVPVVKRSTQSIPPVANYPPENWNEFGQYLWWWVPQEALQSSTIKVYGVEMTRTSSNPYTFEGTGGTGLYFSKIVFDNDGYITSFVAKDSAIGLDTSFGTVTSNTITVDGLDYYKNTMGIATPEPGSSPAVTTSAASSISTMSAIINGTVNPNGNATTAHFEYGLTTSYGTTSNVTLAPSDGTSAQNVSATISNLQAGTTYHFRLVATNGHGTVNSNDATFTTTVSGSIPAVTTSAASSITTTSATLNGTVNPNGNSTTAHFEYGLTTSYGTTTNVTLSPTDGTSAQNVSATISSLQAGTTYHFRLVAINSHGTVNGDDVSFSTTASGGGTSNDKGGGGGGGGIFGAISITDVIGYHLDGVMKNGTKIFMPVTNGYKALKGAQTHVEKFAPGLAKLIRGSFESIERVAEAHKDGMLYRLGTYVFPVLGKVAELYLDAVGSHELMVNAYSGTMISVTEFNKLYQKGIAVSPHVVKDTKK